ncbi:MAG: DNA internalization-related competence protein ComEC/Rec2 [uncultured Solirubrobacteraceae bacterium]|uniref:DNA internalization-related competence protein ComEC/Rec2 n=1 Tax=uncultured Solirubrobacteraceae bacterium TaxID=1162706 RepID=A0A6J4SHZ3_9ACTN|nr:MAG: DNA internalization-related competence protein ComEC/Rec2 [uncultured Solirubrobacteraceae bacterium]
MTACRPLERVGGLLQGLSWSRLQSAREAAAAHPRHLVLAALVAGLLSGPHQAGVAAAVAAGVTGLAANARTATLAVAALVAGMAWTAERTAALEDSVLARAAGTEVTLLVAALEAPRPRPAGGVTFRARVMDGAARGEVGVVRLRATPSSTGDDAAAQGAHRSAALVTGSVLKVSGRMEALAEWEQHQRFRGARAAIVAREWWPAAQRRAGAAGVLDAARDRSREGLSQGIAAPEAALLRGMVLGEDDAVAAATRADFRNSGLAHLLAVSGQNVMLLAMLAMALATVAGASLRTRLAFALVLVIAYVPLAGGGPSIQRAGIMGAAGLVAAVAGRLGDRWYALLLAAALTLATNPLAARDVGWQLSFAAVIGLLAAAAPATRVLVRLGLPRPIAEVSAVTSVATVATAPLLVLHFGELSTVSLPANLLAAPAVAPVMWLGMLAAGVAQLDPVLALPLSWCSGHLVAYIEWVAHVFAALPHSVVELSVGETLMPLAGATVVAGLLAGPARRYVRSLPGVRADRPGKAPRWFLAAGALATVVVAFLALKAGEAAPAIADDELVVSFLDVGQGDATLLQTRRAAILFDTGPPDGPVLERLREAGVERLDALVLTHAQADHEGAAPAVIEHLRPRMVLNGGHGWPTAVQRVLPAGAAPTGVRVVPAHSGQTVSLDGIALTTLWPPPVARPDVTRDPNETALVTHVRHGHFDLLLPADAESGVLRRLDLPRVEALKVSHHGSEDAGLPEVLTRLRPEVAAIEVGRGNSYGHPAPSTLAALRVVPQVARTDRDGTVRVRVRGGRMELER